MDILFTGGACPAAKSVQPLNPSQLKSKFVERNDFDERSSEATTPRYSEKVLVGNWYEERAVRPARLRNEWTTDYVASYQTHDAKDSKEDIYIVWKNKQKTQGSGQKHAIDGESYIDNMTSSYDLNFRILSKGLCGPRVRLYNPRRHAWEPETDPTLSYGNATKYGLADAVKEKRRNEGSSSPLKSTYQFDYIEKSNERDPNEKRYTVLKLRSPTALFIQHSSRPVSLRFLKARGDTNTPDLRHLGIDLSLHSRPIIREPQNRSSRCERVCTWL